MMAAMLAAILLAAAAAAPLQPVCPDPDAPPCGSFKPHDLSFRLPNDEVARAEVRSASFYAVILKSGARCKFTEAERLEAQKHFPTQKVFSTQFGCNDDHENNVTYTNVDPRAGFIAVYAGPDRKLAERALAHVKALGKFPGANLRQMQVVFVYP